MTRYIRHEFQNPDAANQIAYDQEVGIFPDPGHFSSGIPGLLANRDPDIFELLFSSTNVLRWTLQLLWLESLRTRRNGFPDGPLGREPTNRISLGILSLESRSLR